MKCPDLISFLLWLSLVCFCLLYVSPWFGLAAFTFFVAALS